MAKGWPTSYITYPSSGIESGFVIHPWHTSDLYDEVSGIEGSLGLNSNINIGSGNTVAGLKAWNIGYANTVSWLDAGALGTRNIMDNIASMGIGWHNVSSGTFGANMLFGSDNVAYGSAAGMIALGVTNVGNNNQPIFIGRTNTSYASQSILIGRNLTASTSASSALLMGTNIIASGVGPISIGASNRVEPGSDNSVQFGISNLSYGDGNLSVGKNNTTDGYGSAAFGIENYISGYKSAAIGIGLSGTANETLYLGAPSGVRFHIPPSGSILPLLSGQNDFGSPDYPFATGYFLTVRAHTLTGYSPITVSSPLIFTEGSTITYESTANASLSFPDIEYANVGISSLTEGKRITISASSGVTIGGGASAGITINRNDIEIIGGSGVNIYGTNGDVNIGTVGMGTTRDVNIGADNDINILSDLAFDGAVIKSTSGNTLILTYQGEYESYFQINDNPAIVGKNNVNITADSLNSGSGSVNIQGQNFNATSADQVNITATAGPASISAGTDLNITISNGLSITNGAFKTISVNETETLIETNKKIRLNPAEKIEVNAPIEPSSSGFYDIGTADALFKDIYAISANLSNITSTSDINITAGGSIALSGTAFTFNGSAIGWNGGDITSSITPSTSGTLGIGTIAKPFNTIYANQYATTAYTITASTGITVDWNNGTFQKINFNGFASGVITINLSSGIIGSAYILETIQNTSGTNSIAWGGGNILWQFGASGNMTAISGTSPVDMFTFIYDGSKYLGSQSNNYI